MTEQTEQGDQQARRAAADGRRGPRWPRPAVALALVTSIVGGGLVASSLLRPAAIAGDEAPRGTVAVSSTTLVCPDPVLIDPAATSVTAVSPVLDEAPPADGQPVTVEPLGADAPVLAAVDARGPVAIAATPTPVAVSATGALAAGLAATLLTTVPGGDVTGVGATGCRPPTTEAWFAGVGTELGHRPRLVLTNADEVPAEIEVELHGAAGPLEAPTLQAVIVPAGGSVTFELDATAPDQPQLAVVVRALVGRVAASILDTRVEGLNSLGLDWVAPSVPPTTRLIIPGVSGGGGQRMLHVLAPGELDTRVRLRLLTPTGAITPAGLEEIDVPAGSVRTVDLADVTAGQVSTVELVAEQPVVAAVRVVTPVSGAAPDAASAEMAYAIGTAALDGPAVATGLRADDGWTATLTLAADDAATNNLEPATTATVRLSYVDAATGVEAAAQSVSVSAGTTVAVDLAPAGVPPRFSLVVTPTRGDVYAAVQLTRTGAPDAGLTIMGLSSAPLRTEVPRVRHDLSTGLRPALQSGGSAS